MRTDVRRGIRLTVGAGAALVVALTACSNDADAQGTAGTGSTASLGCAADIDGQERCDVAVPPRTEAVELWIWLVGAGTVDLVASTGVRSGCAAGGDAVCVTVEALRPGTEATCLAEGTGSWGCSIQPGGPTPPSAVLGARESTEGLRPSVAARPAPGMPPPPPRRPSAPSPPPPVHLDD
jgi:hypothetical protein